MPSFSYLNANRAEQAAYTVVYEGGRTQYEVHIFGQHVTIFPDKRSSPIARRWKQRKQEGKENCCNDLINSLGLGISVNSSLAGREKLNEAALPLSFKMKGKLLCLGFKKKDDQPISIALQIMEEPDRSSKEVVGICFNRFFNKKCTGMASVQPGFFETAEKCFHTNIGYAD